jgi:hypothetical protein
MKARPEGLLAATLSDAGSIPAASTISFENAATCVATVLLEEALALGSWIRAIDVSIAYWDRYR